MTTEPSEAVQGIVEYTLNHPWKQDFNEGKTKCNVSAQMLSGHLEGIIGLIQSLHELSIIKMEANEFYQ